ncbi:MAG: 3'-5' exonuclease, partial [Bacteroidota bacterium]|nr:3'-5' exonuclease [Bacteroidota bacterium]
MQLKRPLAFIDLEATGVDTVNDRIVEIGIVLLDLEGQETEHRYLVNPTCPIPKEASMIHGIKDEDVTNCPTFEEIAQELFDLL